MPACRCAMHHLCVNEGYDEYYVKGSIHVISVRLSSLTQRLVPKPTPVHLTSHYIFPWSWSFISHTLKPNLSTLVLIHTFTQHTHTHTFSPHYTPLPYFDDMQISLPPHPPSFTPPLIPPSLPTHTHTLHTSHTITHRLMRCGKSTDRRGGSIFHPVCYRYSQDKASEEGGRREGCGGRKGERQRWG